MSRYIIQTYPDLLHDVDNNECNTALHAAEGGNVEILQLLAENGVDVKHKSMIGWDILNVACVAANLDMSRYIIQTYPDLLRDVDNDGWNAALHAADGGNVDILKLLVESKVDVEIKAKIGWIILDVACIKAKLEMSRYTIQTYPDLLKNVNNDGWNVALHAAMGGNVEILKLLAENKVNIKHKNNDGWNILHVACFYAHLEMSRYIIQTYSDLLHDVDNGGWNAGLKAAAGGNIEILQLLTDNDVDAKHTSNTGWNILNAACANNSKLEMSCYIIQTYPDLLHSVSNGGRNAALHAARGGAVEILQLLSDNEVDVKHTDAKGLNIFHLSCLESNLEMSRYIIQTYPDLLHSESNDGRNAALHAARGGAVEILQLLSDNEVDVKHKDAKELNIFDLALLEPKFEMIFYIIQTYPDLLQSVKMEKHH